MTANPHKLPPCRNEKVPLPEVDFDHFIDVQVRFNDIDMFGHVNNGAHLSMLDLAKAAYLSEKGGISRMTPEGIGMVVVNINCDFYSPAYFGEKLTVATGIKRIGEKSVTLTQRLYDPETGDVKCICQTVLAGYNAKTGESAPINLPLALRKGE